MLMWVYFVSDAAGSMSAVLALLQSLVISYVCAYCVTLFVTSLKQLFDKP
jgi:hypothetical protein